MRSLISFLLRRLGPSKGNVATEYALFLVLITLTVMVAASRLGFSVAGFFSGFAGDLGAMVP